MGKINVGRVILGGLLAGLVVNVVEYVLNIYILAERGNAALAKLGLSPPAPQQITWFVVTGFLVGIVLVFTYAAIRPRFGASAKTALIAGAIVWLVSLLYGVGNLIMGIMPSDLALIGFIVSLVELEIAAVAGAWLYKEA